MNNDKTIFIKRWFQNVYKIVIFSQLQCTKLAHIYNTLTSWMTPIWLHHGQAMDCQLWLLISSWPKWPPFRRRLFQSHFDEWNFFYFNSNFTEVCSQGSNWQQGSIGSDNGLAPDRWQAITWTNVNPIHWRIYAALREDELINNVTMGHAWIMCDCECHISALVHCSTEWKKSLTTIKKYILEYMTHIMLSPY